MTAADTPDERIVREQLPAVGVPAGDKMIATVAPRPAPAATPSRYGSASGFRKTP